VKYLRESGFRRCSGANGVDGMAVAPFKLAEAALSLAMADDRLNGGQTVVAMIIFVDVVMRRISTTVSLPTTTGAKSVAVEKGLPCSACA